MAALEEILIGARSVFAADANLETGIAGQAHMAIDLTQQPGAVAAQLGAQVLVGGRRRDVDQMRTEAAAGADVGFMHAAPDHQPRGETEAGDGADAVALGSAHGRNADFHFRHAERVEARGDVEFSRQAEGHAGRLFAVAERGVVDDRRREMAHAQLIASWAPARFFRFLNDLSNHPDVALSHLRQNLGRVVVVAAAS